jgi:TM2 domain-containing membrane protein YozV
MARRRYPSQSKTEKSKVFAGILAFFFGGFGVHKFYLRDPGAGILYLFIFFITSRLFFPLSWFLGWFDAIRLLTMSQEAFDRKYNRNIVREDDYYERQTRSPKSRTRRTTPTPSRRRKGQSAPSRVIQKSNPFKKSGLKKYKEFDLDGAIEDFKQGLKINPRDIALHFNLACAYSLTEKKEDAFYHLSKAVALGYNDFDKIQNHDDLAFLRIQPEFEQFKENDYLLSGSSPEQKSTSKSNIGADSAPEIKDDVLLSQLNKLAELRKKGLLTEDEFMLERKKLLRR